MECSRQAAVMTLRHAAKMTCASSLALSSKAKLVPISDDLSRSNLLQCAERATFSISNLIQTIHNSSADPFSTSTQTLLISQGKEMASADAALVAMVKRTGVHVTDLSKKTDLLTCADMLQKALKDLLTASESCEEYAGGKEAKEAMQGLDALLADFDAAEMAVGTGAQIHSAHAAVPLSQLAVMVDASAKRTRASRLALEHCATSSPEMIGHASLQFQQALSEFGDAVKSMAALERDKKVQREILKESKALVSDSIAHVHAVKRVSVSPSDESLQQAMQVQGRLVSDDIDRVLDVARGVDVSILDDAIKAIATAAQRTKQDFAPTKDFAKYRGDVLEQMESVVAAVENVATAAERNLRALPQTVPVLTHALDELIAAVQGASATVKDPESRPELLRAGVQMATGVVHVLQAAKAIAGGGGGGEQLLSSAKDRVSNANLVLTNAVNPGKVALELAVERVRCALSGFSDSSSEHFTKTPLLDISESARSLGTSTSVLLTSVLNDPVLFARVAQEIAKATEGIVSSSRVAADPGATEYSFIAKKMIDDCRLLAAENDFGRIVSAARSVGLKSTELVGAVSNDTSPMGTQLKPVVKYVAASSLDVYRQLQNVARRNPGSQDALRASVARLQGILEDFHSRSTSGKASNPALTAKLLANTEDVAHTTEDLLLKSLRVSQTPKDSIALNELYRTASALSKGIQDLLSSISGMAPGAAETAESTDKIQASIQKLQVLSLTAIGGKMQRSSESKQACQEQVIAQARTLTGDVAKLVKSTVENQDLIGSSSLSVADTLAKLVSATESLAGTSNTPHQQAATVDMAKGAADSVLQVMLAVRNAAANPFDTDALEQMSQSSQTLRNSISDIVMALQGDFVAQQECDNAIGHVRSLSSSIAVGAPSRESYHVLRKAIHSKAIDLLTSLNNLTQISQSNPDQVGMSAKEVAEIIAPLIQNISSAAGSTSPAVGQEIIQITKSTVDSVLETMQSSKSLAGDRQNAALNQQVSQSLNKVTQLVMKLQESVKQGDVSERTMDDAIRKIRSVASALESAGLMSSAGQFEMDLDPAKTLADYHAELVKKSKDLRVACGEVFLGASGPIDSLAQSTTKLAAAMEAIGVVSRYNAALMSDSFSQQAIIHGAKAITIACQQHVLAAKDANSRPNDPKAEKSLNASNKATDEAISQLMEMASKASADIVENIKRVDEAKAKITTGYGEFSQPTFTGNVKAKPEDLLASSRQISKMSAQIVSSVGNSSDMVVEAVQDIATGIVSLFSDSRGCTRLTNDPQVWIYFGLYFFIISWSLLFLISYFFLL
jgi:hypothetical protein